MQRTTIKSIRKHNNCRFVIIILRNFIQSKTLFVQHNTTKCQCREEGELG